MGKIGGNTGWDSLSSEPRNHNLSRIPELGLLEGGFAKKPTSIALQPGKKSVKRMEKAMPAVTKETKQPTTKSLPVKTVQKGTCDSCGKEKNLKPSKGQNCCSYCQIVRLACSNHPELVLSALRQFGNMPVGVVVGNEEREKIKTEVANLVDITHQKQEKIDELKKEMAAAKDEIKILKEDKDILLSKLDCATKGPDNLLISEIGQVNSRDSVILDLALNIIDGRVSGIDSSTLQSLR